MAYDEVAADYVLDEVVSNTEINKFLGNIIQNHSDIGDVETDVSALQTKSYAFKNRLINGNFIIDQYSGGPFSGTIVPGIFTYCIDRWAAAPAGANVDCERVTGSGAREYHYQFTGAASVTSIAIIQRIEASNIQDLAGENVTLSFDMANSLLTEVECKFRYPTAKDDWTGSAAIDAETVTINSTMTRYSVTVTLPSEASNGLQVGLVVGAQTSGTWTIGNVQLEAGDTVTDFDVREVSVEERMCLRRAYYPAFPINHIVCSGYANSTTIAVVSFHFPIKMAAKPTAILQSGTAANYQILRAGTTIINCSSDLIYSSASASEAGMALIVAAGLTAGEGLLMRTGAATWIGWSVEL